MILTEELIEKGISPKGGFNKKQLSILGIDWPPQKGWKSALVGQTITEEQYNHFIAARKQ